MIAKLLLKHGILENFYKKNSSNLNLTDQKVLTDFLLQQFCHFYRFLLYSYDQTLIKNQTL